MAYNLVTKQVTARPTPIRTTTPSAPVNLTGLGGKAVTGALGAPKSLFAATPATPTLKPIYGNMLPSKPAAPTATNPPGGNNFVGVERGTNPYADADAQAPLPEPELLKTMQMRIRELMNQDGTLNLRGGGSARERQQRYARYSQLIQWFNENAAFFRSTGINTFQDWLRSIYVPSRPDIPPAYNPNATAMT